MNIHEHCLQKNFYFDDDTLYNFHCSLQTKPFTILYGPSGTGKSKIAELYADYICTKRNIKLEDHLCFIPVRPNWTSPSDLMGFYDYLSDTFIPSAFYKFLEKAESDPNNPYFLVLDEMNLSVVEHYFSDFLSCLESRRLDSKGAYIPSGHIDSIQDQTARTLSQAAILAFLDLVDEGILNVNDQFALERIRNHRLVDDWRVKNFNGKDESWMPQFRTEFNQKDNNGKNSRLAGKFFECVSSGVYKIRQTAEYSLNELSLDIVKKIREVMVDISQHKMEIYKNSREVVSKVIPLNLYVIGTINMDESTHPLSSKVLDRANTIEMNDVSRAILDYRQPQSGSLKVDTLNDSFSQIETLPTLESIKKLNDSHPDLVSLIYDINDQLHKFRTNMGHRSIFEIAHYINIFIEGTNTQSDVELAIAALDFQLCQKLIPKLIGADERVEESILCTIKTLTDNEVNTSDQVLHNDLTGFAYPKTLEKLQRMYKYYNQNGFVNFANV